MKGKSTWEVGKKTSKELGKESDEEAELTLERIQEHHSCCTGAMRDRAQRVIQCGCSAAIVRVQ